MTNKEFIKIKLFAGKTIWRYTNVTAISYTKVNNGVERVRHGVNGCTNQVISMSAAVAQITRNFKQVSNIH